MADKMMRIAGRDSTGLSKAIKTDEYGNLGVQLSGSVKSTATQKMDFAGKISGNNEVPHTAKVLVNASSTTPFISSFTSEITDTNYGRLALKDNPGGVMLTTATTVGYYTLHLFGFNLLADLKNKGKIPNSWTVKELRANTKQLLIEWLGKGEGSNAGVLSNGVTLKLLDNLNTWITLGSHTSSAYTAITNTYKNPNNLIQDDGFVYFLANPNYPTDATVTAKVYSDYISVDVQFNTDVMQTDISKAYDENLQSLKTISTMTKSSLQKRSTISNELTVAAGVTSVLLANYEFTDNVTAWGLYGLEINRPSSEIFTGLLELVIEYSNTSNDFGIAQSTGKAVFTKNVKFSDIDEMNKAFATISNPANATGTNLIVSGKFFNIPMARYMRLSIKNVNSNAFRFLPFTMVEEGNF